MPAFTRLAAAALCSAAALSAACGGDSSTSTTSTSPSVVAADPTVTESFSAVVRVGGAVFYSFPVPQFGTVNVTLTSLEGDALPETPALTVGIGRPAGTTCSATSTLTVSPGDAPQVTGAWGPGIFCVYLADPGTLVAPARFTASVAHP